MMPFPERYHCVNCHHAWTGFAGKQTCRACGSIEVEWVNHPLVDLVSIQRQKHRANDCIMPLAGFREFCECPYETVWEKRKTLADYGRSVKITREEMRFVEVGHE